MRVTIRAVVSAATPCPTHPDASTPLVAPTLQVLETALEIMQQAGIRYLGFTDPGYPRLLAQIDDAPLGLFFQGEITYHNQPFSLDAAGELA